MSRTKRMTISLLAFGVLCGNPAVAQVEKMDSNETILKYMGADTVDAAIVKVTKECNEGKIESTYTNEIQNDALHACVSGIMFGWWRKAGSPPSSPPWAQPQLLQEAQLVCKKRYGQVLKAVTDKDWTSEAIARICAGDLGPLLQDKPELTRDLAAAERRLKEAKAKLEALGVNEKGEPKGGPPKSPGETPAEVSMLDKDDVEAAAKEYREAEGAVRRSREAVEKIETPELKELRQLASGEDKEMKGYFWFAGNGDCNDIIGLERQMCKIRTGNRILSGRPDFRKFDDWVLAADPAADPGLPRADESVRKAGTAKTVDMGPSTSSTGSPQAGSGQGGVKLELVWIPAGEFMMGSRKGEVGRFVIELRRRVKLTKGFWMGKYEVTQEQWEKLMGYNPSGFTNAGPRAPVECVNVTDCQRFMTKLNRSAVAGAGKFRLPTEAEWEWACRAGTDGPLYTGTMTLTGANNSPELDAIAWYGGNSGVEYEGGYDSSHWPDKQKEFRFAGTHPVGQKKANAWGLHDMLGNVREWCQDGFDEWDSRTFASRSVTDPVGKEIDNHIMRGGSWSDLARQCRCPSRQYRTGMRAWHRSIGFRVAMDEPAAAEKAK